MSIDPKWLGERVTENEYGETERWGFHFKRPTSRAMLSFAKAEAATNDTDRVELVIEALHGIIASVTVNGEPSSIDDMPFDLCVEVLPMHPTFRGPEDTGA